MDDTLLKGSLELSEARRRRHTSTRKGRSDPHTPQQAIQHEKRVASATERDGGDSEDGSIRSSSVMSRSSSARLVCPKIL